MRIKTSAPVFVSPSLLAWLAGAHAWAEDHELETRRWRAGQEFETSDGHWHAIRWDDRARSWAVSDAV